jgi:cell division protein FtsQ
VLIVAVVAAYRTSSFAVQTHLLPISRIVVRGNERLSVGEVQAVLAGLRGQSLVWTDLDAWRKRLLSSPWVRDAALRRSLPSTVEVVVWERQPIGIGRIHEDTYLVDERGVIIDQYGPQYADLDLPLIDGLTGSSTDDGSLTDEARAVLAARVIASLKAKPDIARRLSQVDVADLHNAAVLLSGDAAIIQLGEDHFLERLQSYLELAPTLHERVAEIDYVDVRFDNRIYVRPVPKAAKSPAKAVPRPARDALSLSKGGPREKNETSDKK